MAGVQKVDAATVKQWLDEGTITLVDVRQPNEYAAKHIPGAVLVPLSTFVPQAVPREAGKRLVVHCQSGMRAADACKRLVKAGVDPVYCFEGGMGDWLKSGLATEGAEATAADPNAKPVACCGMSVQRQTQLSVGLMTLVFVLLGQLVNHSFGWLVLLPALGLINAGATGLCPLATGIAKLPWNN